MANLTKAKIEKSFGHFVPESVSEYKNLLTEIQEDVYNAVNQARLAFGVIATSPNVKKPHAKLSWNKLVDGLFKQVLADDPIKFFETQVKNYRPPGLGVKYIRLQCRIDMATFREMQAVQAQLEKKYGPQLTMYLMVELMFRASLEKMGAKIKA